MRFAVPAVAAALLVAAWVGQHRSAGNALAAPGPVACRGCWKPAPGQAWQWQLTGPIDLGVRADVFDTDLFDTPAPTIRALHLRGKRTVCYLSAGTWERWRPDARSFPRQVLGKPGWPAERWVDVRRLRLLQPVLTRRLDLCKAKGFDGVEFDNVDVYTNPSGFRISPRAQLRFNKWLADRAHERGLAAVLKNDLDQVDELLPYFDAILVEQCAAFDECSRLEPFTRVGKPAIDVEYRAPNLAVCRLVTRLGIQLLQKRPVLGPETRRPCVT